MALTAEEKARNKAANQRRGKAHTARRKEFDNAEKKALQTVDERYLDKVNAANTAWEKLRENNIAERQILEQEIAALNERLRAMNERHRHAEDLLHEPRSKINREYYAAKQEATKEVEARFSDMAGGGRWSAAAWGATDFAKKYIEDFHATSKAS